MEKPVDSASPLDITDRGWIRVEDQRPHIGEKCLIWIDGVVQHEVYEYDESDDCPAYWSKDDIDECPFVKDGQFWMPLPEAPNAEFTERP